MARRNEIMKNLIDCVQLFRRFSGVEIGRGVVALMAEE